MEENIKNYSEKIKENDSQIYKYLAKNQEIQSTLLNSRARINEIDIEIGKTKDEKETIDNKFFKVTTETNISKRVIENAEKVIIKYQEKIKLAKNSLTEDYAIATLLKDFKNLDIIGYVFNLIKWNDKYQKAVVASGNEWMKAVIVKDIKSMITLAEFSKNKGIHFLKIIPLELLNGDKLKDIEDNPSILGVLSDFVSSKVKYLPEFLFGNTILTKNPLTAYLLSNNGFKAVSTSGEIFFPNLSLMQFDYGSKIADVTKDLLLSDSIENLRINIEKLQELTKIRISELDVLNEERTPLGGKLDTFTLERSNIIQNINELENLLVANNKNLSILYTINKEHSMHLDDLFRNFNYSKRRFNIITSTNSRIDIEIKNTNERIDMQKVMKIEEDGQKINGELDIINNRLNQLKLTNSMVKNNIENTTRAHNKSIQEYEQFKIEKNREK